MRINLPGGGTLAPLKHQPLWKAAQISVQLRKSGPAVQAAQWYPSKPVSHHSPSPHRDSGAPATWRGWEQGPG